jgi:mRNA interferase RelE/StbE
VKYRLIYTRRALRDIDGLDDLTKKRIGKALARYEGDPFKHSERMTDARLGTYRFRIGDYRVIFDVEGKDIVVLRWGIKENCISAYKTHTRPRPTVFASLFPLPVIVLAPRLLTASIPSLWYIFSITACNCDRN